MPRLPAGPLEAVCHPIHGGDTTFIREAAVKGKSRDSWRASVRVGLVAVLLTGLSLTGRSETPADKTREQEIADVQKQIEALNKQLAELKKPPAESPSIPDGALPSSWVSALNWRSIGPATMGGRITAISVFEADPTTYWVATASGGLLKTTNNGITFEHQFDHENTVSIGDVCVAPSDRNIVWVGTGESNPRNSVSYGDGVYKSTDGGKKWTNMGLTESFQISKILIHPKDPNIVYVGALGRLYGSNSERGVFKTTDGGKTWEKVLYVDDKTGCIDLRMSPADPNIVLAGMWERKRDEFDSFIGSARTPQGVDNYSPVVRYGKGGGIFRTADAGKTWKKIDKGVPTCATGRIGLDFYQKDPNVVFAIIDSEKNGAGHVPPYMGFRGEDADGGGVKLTEIIAGGPAAKAPLKVDDVLLELDGKKLENYDKTVAAIQSKKVGDKLTFKVQREGKAIDLVVTLESRPTTGPGAGGNNAPPAGPYIGLRGEDVTEGVKLTEIVEAGPAQKAGLKVEDVLVEFDGKKIENYDNTIEAIQAKKVGDKLKFKVKRGDQSLDVTVALEARPNSGPGAGGAGGQGGGRRGGGGQGFGQFADSPWPGFFGRDSENGIVVRNVTEDSSAAKAGIKTDDVILEMNGKAVAEFRVMLESLREKKVGDKVKFLVQSGSEKKTVEVALEQFRGGFGGGFGGGGGGGFAGRPYGADMSGQAENRQNQQGAEGYQTGGVYKSTDAGETWTRINSINPRPMYFSQVRVDPSDDKNVYVLGVSFAASTDGGKTFRTDRQANSGVHSDQHALWINPKDGRHMLIGTDGGFYLTHDRMKQWEHLSLAALGQFYHVCVDSRKPYRVFGGLQDNGSWGGPSRTLRRSGPMNEDWFSIGGGDGFVCRVDPYDPDLVYSESQDGAVRRRNLRTGEGASIRPRAAGAQGGGPGGGQAGGRGGRGGAGAHRFNWNTPFILSAHNPGIVYIGGEMVFRSLKHGDDAKAISPEITRTKRGSATALAESPRNPDVLWVGTDDGAIWVTRDGGREWKRVDEKVGLPGPRWVATIEASRFAEGRAYVCFDAHRSNDDKPYLYVTEDYGQTWKPITNNLPAFGSTRCLREDVQNQNLLFCGTEFAAFASLNRGGYWTKINNNLPTVAVHEFAIHPTAGEMVAATHGRSLWVLDVAPLRQMAASVVKAPAHLYAPTTATRWRQEPELGSAIGNGSKKFFGRNPENGAAIYYSLGKKPEKVSLKVLDYSGQTVRELTTKSEPGLHRVLWNLTRAQARSGGQGNPEQGGRRGGGFGFGGGQPVPPGQYRVVLNVDGKEYSQGIRVEADPSGVQNGIAVDGDDDDGDGEIRNPLLDP